MRTSMVLMLSFVIVGCATQQAATGGGAAQERAAAPSDTAEAVSYAGGDGSSAETAVIIKAPNESEGVDAEYAWLRMHGVRCQQLSQSLMGEDGRWFDVLECTTPEGKTRKFYFDITSFFGKM